MWPRLIWREWSLRQKAKPRRPVGFNVAAPDLARMDFDCRKRHDGYSASMWPRLICAGWVVQCQRNGQSAKLQCGRA